MFLKKTFVLTLLGAVMAGPIAAESITLKNGDIISGDIVETTDEAIVVESAVVGRVTIAKDQIDTAPGGLNNATAQRAEEAVEWVDSWFFPGWKKNFAAGLTGSSGNSETINIYSSLTTGYEDETDRWAVNLRYLRNSSEGETSQNEFKATVLKDWMQTDSPWFYWAQGLYQYDDFQAYLHRVGGFVGIGYEFFDTGKSQLLGRVGAGLQYEAGDVDEFTPEAFLGLEYTLQIDDAQSFKAYNYLYPSLDNFKSDFRNVTGVAYDVKLAAGDGMSLRIGAENEHQSDPGDGRKKNDLKYYAAVAVDF